MLLVSISLKCCSSGEMQRKASWTERGAVPSLVAPVKLEPFFAVQRIRWCEHVVELIRMTLGNNGAC